MLHILVHGHLATASADLTAKLWNAQGICPEEMRASLTVTTSIHPGSAWAQLALARPGD